MNTLHHHIPIRQFFLELLRKPLFTENQPLTAGNCFVIDL